MATFLIVLIVGLSIALVYTMVSPPVPMPKYIDVYDKNNKLLGKFPSSSIESLTADNQLYVLCLDPDLLLGRVTLTADKDISPKLIVKNQVRIHNPRLVQMIKGFIPCA